MEDLEGEVLEVVRLHQEVVHLEDGLGQSHLAVAAVELQHQRTVHPHMGHTVKPSILEFLQICLNVLLQFHLHHLPTLALQTDPFQIITHLLVIRQVIPTLLATIPITISPILTTRTI